MAPNAKKCPSTATRRERTGPRFNPLDREVDRITATVAPAIDKPETFQLRHLLVLAVLAKPVVDLFWQTEILGVGPLGLNPQRVLALMVPVLCAALVATQPRATALREPAIYAFLGLAALGTVANGAPPSALAEFMRWVSNFSVLLVIPIALRSEADMTLALKGLVIVSLIPTFVSYLQLAGIVPFYYADFTDFPVTLEAARGVYENNAGAFGEGIGRASGGYVHPTSYTNYILVAIPAAYALHRARAINLAAFVSFLGFTFPAVFFTYARTSYLVIAVQLAIMAAVSGQRRMRQALVLGLVAGGLLVGTSLWKIFSAGLGGSFPNLFRGRGLMWILYLEHWIRGTPWQQLFGFANPDLVDVTISKGLPLNEPHSDYVRVFYTCGIVGLAVYLRVLWIGLRGSVTLTRDTAGSDLARGVGTAAFMVIVGVILASVVTEPLRYTSFGWPFALVVAPAFARRSGLYVLN